MATAAQVTIPDGVKATRCDLWRDTPGRLGGRLGTYGHFRPNIDRGVRFWRAEIEFGALMRGRYDAGLAMEAALGRVQAGMTVRVPVGRQQRDSYPFYFLDSRGDRPSIAAVPGPVVVSAGGKRLSVTGAAEIVLKPGALFTVDHELYQYYGETALNATQTDVTDTEPAFAATAGETVEVVDPYFVGLLPEGQSIRLAKTDSTFGPWDVPLVEAR